VSEPVAEVVCDLAARLPPADVAHLGAAAGAGRPGLVDLRARASSAVVRAACDDLLACSAPSGQWLAGALRGASAASERAGRRQSIEVAWTGPESGVDSSRLTAPAIVDLMGEVTRELMVVSFATHDEVRIGDALHDAAARGVDIVLVTERTIDNPLYRGPAHAFPALRARRWAWPATARPTGAAMHAKAIVVDSRVALVGSANLTGRGLIDNLECGILIRGGPQPAAIRDHLWSLHSRGALIAVPST